MNVLRTLTLGLLVAWFPIQADADTLSLRDVYLRAQRSPMARAADARTRGAQAAATAERRQALWPSLSASIAPQLRDREFTLDTPVGSFAIGDALTTQGRIRLSVPLMDATRLFYTSRARSLDAKAATLSARRTKRELAGQATELYFDALVLRARDRALAASETSLGSRLREVEALVGAGRGVNADRLRVQLALDDLKQARLAVRENLRVLERAIGRAIGSDRPIKPAEFRTPQVSTESGVNRRSDLAALRTRIEAVDLERKGVWSELIPRVELAGDAVYTDAGPQAETVFFAATVNLTWLPFAAGTRGARADAARARRSALSEEYRDSLRGARVQVENAKALIAIAEGELRTAELSVQQAEEAARVALTRYRAGRETIQDVLDTEAVVRDRRARREIAGLEKARATIRLAVATGRDPRW